MNQTEIKELLQKKYDRNNWISLLKSIFDSNSSATNIFTKGKSITAVEPAKTIKHIGNIKLDANKHLAFIEVEVAENVQLNRNRVQLRNLSAKLVDQDLINGALVVYYKENESNYRFSFIAKQSEFDGDGQLKKTETHPKRFTYILGENESCTTASQRFLKLADRDNLFTSIKDILDAFNVEKLSKEFFKEYKEFYNKFIDDILKSKSKVALFKEEKHIRDFVKKMLGRIVFLYFVQKKGWLGASDTKYKDGNNNFLQTLFELSGKNESFYPTWLNKLFFDTLNNNDRNEDNFEMPNKSVVKIPYLNGGLFEKDENDTDLITFNPSLFDDLFQFFSRYNFTIYEDSPEEQTVAVDPEMLGHIFENLLEDNKDKGAFYTPKEIVHYMTQESLIEYLHTHLPNLDRKELEYFVKEKDFADFASLRENILEINSLLTKVKICDPAIGSGAFPMGLLQEIYFLKELIQNQEGFKIESPAKLKESIIQNSIYGVDIEQGAVDIARLRFWLSLVVDEDEPRTLPNLDYKIVVGNSLVSKFEDEVIEIDWDVDTTKAGLFGEELLTEKQSLLNKINKKQKEFFHPEKGNKNKLTNEIRNLKIDLLSTELEIMIKTKGLETKPSGNSRNIKQQTELYLKTEGWKNTLSKLKNIKQNPNAKFRHFDWKLDFPEILNPAIAGENQGFDIVIGNPPYIKEYIDKSAFDGARSHRCYQGKMDIWYLFACIGLDMLTENGTLTFIAQNNWVTSYGAKKFRDKIVAETKIRQMIDFGSYMIFEEASIQTMIMLFKRNKSVNNYTFDYRKIISQKPNLATVIHTINKNYSNEYISLNPNFNREDFLNKSLLFNENTNESILEKLLLFDNFYLSEDEVAQGIVFPQDFLNKKNSKKLNNKFEVGSGIFVLNHDEKSKLGLNRNEIEIIKPYFTSKELFKYIGNPNNSFWIIYTDSSFKNESKMNSYPKIKTHLDKFKKVITSDNKPYGLHRARDEKFFKGEKVISLRKCSDSPTFTYTDFICYVSATFYVIKTARIDMKFLAGLLNSKLFAFWFKYKGKMQGNNYQIDKEPLMNAPIPVLEDTTQKPIIKLVEKIISDKKTNKDTTALEQQIDNMVYKLYDLTYEEVLIVQPNFTEIMSKEEYDKFEGENCPNF